jgi:tape measure domain-containing protein
VEKLSWLFELQDRMSGPAGKIASSLKKLDAPMKSAGRSTGLFQKMVAGIGNTFGARASRSFIGMAGAVAKVGDGLKAVMPVAQKVGSGLLAVGGIMATAGLAAGAAVGGLSVLGGKWLVDSMAFRENTLGSLEAMLKSKSAAESVFNDAVKFAAKTPFSTSQVADSFQKLVAAGFKPAELQKVMTNLGDFAGADAEKLQSAILVMGQIKGKGKLQGEELMQLAERGLPMGKVLEQLAKQLGKTKDQTQALLSAGKINADVGIGAVMSVINDQFGGRMDKAATSLTGLWSTLKSAPEDLLFNPETAKAMEPMVAALKGLLTDVIASFGPTQAGGKLLVDVFKGAAAAIKWIAEALRSVDMKGIFTRLSTVAGEVMPKIRKLFDDVIPKVRAFFDGFTKFVNLETLGKVASDVFERISKHLGGMDGDTLTKVGKAVGWLLITAIDLVLVLLDLSLAISGFGMKAIGFFGDVATWVGKAVDKVGELRTSFDGLHPAIQGAARAVGIVLLSFLGPIPQIIATLSTLPVSIGAIAKDAAGKFLFSLLGPIPLILSTLGSLPEQVTKFGKDAMGGFLLGLLGPIPQIIAAVAGMVTSIIGAVKSGLKSASPSGVFQELGMFTGEGFILGLMNSGIQQAMSNAVKPPLNMQGLAASVALGGSAISPAAGLMGALSSLLPVFGGATASMTPQGDNAIRPQGGTTPIVSATPPPPNQNFNLSIPSIVMNVTSENGEEVAKQAAGSFTAQLGAALKKLGSEAGR